MLPEFASSDVLHQEIDAYFNQLIPNTVECADNPNTTTQKSKQNEPATISGLAFYLGFDSLDDFSKYERTGKFGGALKRGRLRIEVVYEKMLHYSSPTGAIFALKGLGWDIQGEKDATSANAIDSLFKVEVVNNGFAPANTESHVDL